jgi:hypothetical protein
MDMFIPFGSFDMNCTAYIKVYSLPKDVNWELTL